MIEANYQISVLFVCMGNICRSPTAEGVFRRMVTDAGLAEVIRIDSAGTHAYHVGEPPDRRSQEAALRRGVALADLRARRVNVEDFKDFDYIVAMDSDNLRILNELLDKSELPVVARRARVSLFLPFADSANDEVPDPYYGGPAGFERVLDLVEEASRALLETLRRSHAV
jgi:protein-tyrosine phosphatase